MKKRPPPTTSNEQHTTMVAETTTTTKKRPRNNNNNLLPRVGVGGTTFMCLPVKEPSMVQENDEVRKNFFIRPVDGETAAIMVCNVSIDDSPERLKKLFTRWGVVRTVKVSRLTDNISKPDMGIDQVIVPGRIAKVIFKDPQTVQALMETTLQDVGGEDGGALELGRVKDDNATGMTAWLQSYAKNVSSDFDTAQRDANKEMESFEKMEAKHKKKANEVQVDEDGFTLVTRKSGAPRVQANILVGVPLKTANVLETTAVDNDDEPPFYKFQRKERKKIELDELRKKFEKDKIQSAVLKASAMHS